jgi:hypothetical protein
MAKTITALYKTPTSAGEAVDRLMDKGFSQDDVSVLMNTDTHGRAFGIKESSKAPEGAAAGGALGGALGAIAGGLTAVGTLATGGAGIIAAGPVVAALAGGGVGAAAGGVLGGLMGWGVTEHEAKLYADGVENGHILVGVKAHNDRADAAVEVLKNTGGGEIHTR